MLLNKEQNIINLEFSYICIRSEIFQFNFLHHLNAKLCFFELSHVTTDNTNETST